MAAGFEADGVDGAVDFGHAEDVFDLVFGVALGDVDCFAAEAGGFGEPVGVEVGDEDGGGARSWAAVAAATPTGPAPAM